MGTASMVNLSGKGGGGLMKENKLSNFFIVIYHPYDVLNVLM